MVSHHHHYQSFAIRVKLRELNYWRGLGSYLVKWTLVNGKVATVSVNDQLIHKNAFQFSDKGISSIKL